MAMNIGDLSQAAVLLQQQNLAPRKETDETSTSASDDGFVPGETPETGLIDRGRVRAHQTDRKKLEQRLSGPDEALERYRQFRRSDDPEQLRELRMELRGTERAVRTGAMQGDRSNLRMALGDVNQSIARFERIDRERKWDKVVDGLQTEPSPTYKAYFANSDVSIKEMRSVIASAEDLSRPDSPQRIRGNEVETLPRDRIWAAKMNLLAQAVEQPVRNGRPVEIDAEYYELSSPEYIDRLNRAASNGANVRVLIDSGRIQQGPEGSSDASSLASRLNTLAQLQDGAPEGANKPAVALFANQRVLGSRDELMHRKLLRVGDEVVFGGMNANEGSGENVDFAMKIRGPANAHFVDTFRGDVESSAGADTQDVFGTQLDELRAKGADVRLDRAGMRDFLASMTAGQPGTQDRDFDRRVRAQIDALEAKGVDVTKLALFPDGNRDGKVDRADVEASLNFKLEGHGGHVRLTPGGADLLATQLESRVERTAGKENVAALRDIATPSSDAPPGADDTLAIADHRIERQAAVLQAIDGAERFVKVSAFVVTRDVASALIEKRDQMVAQGKDFQVQVALDPGLYGYGGTPNTRAYKMLEDAGIDVKWSLLDRTDPGHDRKNHSKLIITDRQMIAGSTNFSKKGLRQNWEMSDVTWFGEDDDSRARQKQVVSDFDRAWERESIGINTRALADARYAGRTGDDVAFRKDEHRDLLLRRFLQGIGNYEREAGAKIQAVSADPAVASRVESLQSHGISHGYAVLDVLGPERLQQIRETRPAYQALLRMQERGLPVMDSAGRG